MKTLLSMVGTICVCASAFARPLVLESPTVVPANVADFSFAGDEFISTNWDWVVGTDPEEFRTTASLYQRGPDGEWTFARNLATEVGDGYTAPVGMTATVAAIAMPTGLRIWERVASGWVEASVDSASRLWGGKVAVAGNTVLMTEGTCSAQAAILTRATNGVWAVSARLAAPAGGCIANLDLDEGRAIVHVDFADDAANQALIFERSGTSWTAVATLQPQGDDVVFGSSVALRGTLAIVSGTMRGAHVYQRGGTGWQHTGFLVNPDSYDEGQYDSAIAISDLYVVKVSWNINRRTSVAYVYRRAANQTFEHVANLATSSGNGFFEVRIDGSRVVATTGEPHVFDLPASFDVPPLVQEDFESGAAGQWTPIPGSQFSIVSNGQTRVYRQSSLAGDAGAIHSAVLANQHISADIRPLAFNGSDRWVGLITRYTDSANYYYLTWRSSGRLVLKRMRNGVFTDLASYPLSGSMNWQRIGLESSGTHHAVYVDGRLVTQAFDASHAQGRSGIRMYRASADFDNVVVSPGPVAYLIYTDRVATGGDWTQSWHRGGETFSQMATNSADARAVSGLPREDVVVQAGVQIDGFASSGSSWAGLIARYADSGNYYYVTLRANELSLRRLTNGAISVLDSESFVASPGSRVNLRLEAIGDRLRVYVNNELRLEHAGAEVRAGKVGVMTYRAAATFSDYGAIEP